MTKCNPYYTTEDKDNDTCYHNNSECPSGSKIKDQNKAYGTGGRHLCKTCKDMNK